MSDVVEFRHLEFLVAIVLNRSVTKAAAQLYRSQPGVTHTIKELENSLGVPLLIRGGREGVYPTAAGEVVLKWARTILNERSEVFRMARAIHEGTIPPFRLGFSSFVRYSLIDNLCKTYRGMFSGSEMQLSSGGTDHLLEKLDRGLLDGAILPLPIDQQRYKVQPLAQSPLAVCMRIDDPLCEFSSVEIHEAAARVTVFPDAELHPAVYARIIELFAGMNIPVRPTHFAATPADMQLMVKQGCGLALMDGLSTFDAGLTTRPLDGLEWSIRTAFVTSRNSAHVAIPFLERLLDEDGLGRIRKPPLKKPVSAASSKPRTPAIAAGSRA
jgi:LysR family transcriptional regulator, hydrogen peroxide-inducible genes activator